jgi:hypothetical protein
VVESGLAAKISQHVHVHQPERLFAVADPRFTLTTSTVWTSSAANQEQFRDATYAQTIDTINVETDPTRLKHALSQLNDILLDQSFVIPFLSSPPRCNLRSNVNGMMPLARSLRTDGRVAWLMGSASDEYAEMTGLWTKEPHL